MRIIEKYKSDIQVKGKDWHAGICFYTLIYLEFEIYENKSCRLTRKIFLDKSGGGFNRDESVSWQGDLSDMRGTKYVLLKPEKEGNQDLKIWFEKVPKHNDLIYLDILRSDVTGEFKYSEELILKQNKELTTTKN